MLAIVKRAPCGALASLALAALLAGCGGGSHAASGGTSATTPAAGTPAPGTPATTPASQAPPTSPSTRAPASPGTYGHVASASEQAAVARAVQAYYTALSSGHQVAACGMLTTRVQRRLRTIITHTPLLHGKGCATAFKLIFGHGSVISPTVSVKGVRVDGDNGYALFSTQSIPSAQIRVEREHGVWKIASLIGSPIAGSSASRAG